MRRGPRLVPSLALASFVAALLGGCGHTPVPAFPEGSDAEQFASVGEETPPGMEPQPPEPMRLLPGDVVKLDIVATETTTYESLTVDGRGQLHVPLAGDVEVGGLTPTEAEERIEKAVGRLRRVAEAVVTVTDPAGHQATIVGAVAEPGRVEITPGARVADLVATAGGPTTEVTGGERVLLADLAHARLMRDGEALPISLVEALEGHPRHNVRIRPGDHLYIPPVQRHRVSVLGEVGSPAVVSHRQGLRLTEALAIAGGITRDADDADVRIVRGLSDSPELYVASLDDVVDGDGYDPVLAPGDVVYVTEKAFASFSEVLDRLSPLLTAMTTAGVTTAVILAN